MALFLLVLTIGIVLWTLAHPSAPHWSDDPECRQWLRQSLRTQRRQDWLKTRQVWRTCFWHRDAGPIMGLIAFAAFVGWLCS